MKQKLIANFILASGLAFALIACKSKSKTDEPANTDDKKTETATAPARDPAMDPVKVAPGVYHVLADTMNIRLLEITVKPGEPVPVHSHPDYSIYVIDGGTGEFTLPDGTKQTQELKSGMGMVVPAETHSPKNTGTTTMKIIATEVYSTAAATRDAATDPVKIAPGVYKVLADTMNIRLSEVIVKPGDGVTMHSHPVHTIYVAAGGTLEFEAKDGKKSTMELKTGMGVVAPAESHAGKNIGTTTVRLIVTEAFRQ